MASMQWLIPHITGGVVLPHQYAANRDGVAFAMIRAHANGTTSRVSVFPSGDASRAIKALAGSEAQAKRWASKQKELPVQRRT